jgi:hypothetical protein
MALELWFKTAAKAPAKWHALFAGAGSSPCGIEYAERAVVIRKADAEPELWAGVVRDTGLYTGCRTCRAAVRRAGR